MAEERAKAKQQAADPNTQWQDHDRVWGLSLIHISPAPLADVYKDFSKLETDYMSIVAQCVEDRADDLLKKEQQQNPPKVYRQSITYARQHNEVQQYRESYRLNERCGDEINGAIALHYDGMRLGDGAVKPVSYTHLDGYKRQRLSRTLNRQSQSC